MGGSLWRLLDQFREPPTAKAYDILAPGQIGPVRKADLVMRSTDGFFGSSVWAGDFDSDHAKLVAGMIRIGDLILRDSFTPNASQPLTAYSNEPIRYQNLEEII